MKKILAIDDNELNLKLLQGIIEKYYSGFTLLKALNGSDGIKLAKEEIPELILLDILMPGLNGYEVCRILKNNTITVDIPVIMISALGLKSEERIKGLNAGADAFISKPFDNNELRAQINVILRIKSVEDLLRKRNENLELSIKTQTNKYLQREERILQISEHVRQFYWETDENGIIVYISPVIENILKIPPLEIIGKLNYTELFQFDEKNNPFKTSKDAVLNEVEIVVRVNKTKLWLAFNSFPFFNGNGKYCGIRGVCFDITSRKKAELEQIRNLRKIERYQQKLKELNKEISLVEERERKQIAENLHDGLGQTLSLAYIKLSSISFNNISPEVKETIETVSELINKAIKESRTITYDLSPPVLYEFGLIAALRWKLDQVERKYNIHTIIYDYVKDLKIEKKYIIFVYRIFNELIQNIIKHAMASNIILHVKESANIYTFELEDDGIGIDYETRSRNILNGFGLMSVRERIESFNGHFQIKSEPGKGTKAIIEFPVQIKKNKNETQVYKKNLEQELL